MTVQLSGPQGKLTGQRRTRMRLLASLVQFTDTTGTTAAALGGPVAVHDGWAVLFIRLSPGQHMLAAIFAPHDPAAYQPSTSNQIRLGDRDR